MTKSEIMKLAHAEARKFRASRPHHEPVTYAQAMVVGLRRAHCKAAQERTVAAILAQPKAPQFMWLRGF